ADQPADGRGPGDGPCVHARVLRAVGAAGHGRRRAQGPAAEVPGVQARPRAHDDAHPAGRRPRRPDPTRSRPRRGRRGHGRPDRAPGRTPVPARLAVALGGPLLAGFFAWLCTRGYYRAAYGDRYERGYADGRAAQIRAYQAARRTLPPWE